MMNVQTVSHNDYQNYENVLVSIVRTLPPHRAEQLVDFARFLEAQRLTEKLAQAESIEEVEADNIHWDELLATEASQTLLEKLASEALAEHRAGKTRPMTFLEDGRITPG
jgi:hypothetical protein